MFTLRGVASLLPYVKKKKVKKLHKYLCASGKTEPIP